MRIGFIGGGVMGEAMISGILSKGLFSKKDIVVSEVNETRRQHIEHMLGVEAIPENNLLVDSCDFLVLAVKPQSLGEVFEQLRGSLNQHAILSIVAGASVEMLSIGFDHKSIVRAMPNTPGQIGEGITVWTAAERVTIEQREISRQLLSALGREIYVDEEKYLNMATAVSGSGPAYVFLFIESFIDAAVHVGLPRDMAADLVFQTVLGSTLFASKSDKHLAELRNMVTSPAGTTAAGVLELEDGKIRAALVKAVVSAFERANALGGLNNK